MSTAETAVRTLPPLKEGERLDQPTFHERYEAMPPGTWAELLDGVVHMSSPVGSLHARAQVPSIVWLSYYEEHTPGVEALDNASVIVDARSEPQPDASLRILPECGGRTQDVGRFVGGVPELILEVSHTARSKDLGPKLKEYERVGVLEYVVLSIQPDEVIWHRPVEGRLVAVPADPDGLHRSSTFPGLWLDPLALIARDTGRLRQVVDLGLATPEHAAFVARLAAARPAPPERPDPPNLLFSPGFRPEHREQSIRNRIHPDRPHLSVDAPAGNRRPPERRAKRLVIGESHRADASGDPLPRRGASPRGLARHRRADHLGATAGGPAI